ALRQLSTRGIERQLSIRPAYPSAGYEIPAFSRAAKSVVLERHKRKSREMIVDLRDIYFSRRDAGAREQVSREPLAVGRRIVIVRHVVTSQGSCSPIGSAAVRNGKDIYRLAGQIVCPLARRNHYCTGTIRLQTAVVQPERLGDPPRLKVLLPTESSRMH